MNHSLKSDAASIPCRRGCIIVENEVTNTLGLVATWKVTPQRAKLQKKLNTDKALPKPEHNAAHRAQWTQTSKTQRSRQNKTNMETHRSLQRTLLQAEIQKSSQKQPFTHSDSKKNTKENPDLLPSANMRNRNSTFKNWRAGSTRAPKEHFKESLTMHSNGQNTPATLKLTTLPNSRN